MEESVSHFQFSTLINIFSLSLICPSIHLIDLQSLRFEVSIGFIEGNSRISLFPTSYVTVCFSLRCSSLSCAFSLNSRFSFLFQVDMESSPFRQSLHTESRSLFLVEQVPSTLASDSLPRTSFQVLDHMSALSHGFTTLADTCCGIPLAAAC